MTSPAGIVKVWWVEGDPQIRAVVALRVRDLDILAEAISGTRLNPTLLGDHVAPSDLCRLICPEVTLDLSRIGPAMLFSGVMPEDCYTLSLITECPGKGHSFNFGLDYSVGYLGFFPPGAAVDSAAPAGCGNAIITIPVETFRREVAIHFPEIPDSMLEKGAGFKVGPGEFQRLRRLLADVEKLIEADGGGDLGRSSLARKNLESELLAAFISALRGGGGPPVHASGARLHARRRRLDLVREYVAAHAREAVSVEDIARVAGVTSRGLEKLFRECLDVTPHAYVVRQRLCGANRDLARAPSELGAVKKIALSWGFWHMGRFAHDYRSVFGESPSQTLAARRGGEAPATAAGPAAWLNQVPGRV